MAAHNNDEISPIEPPTYTASSNAVQFLANRAAEEVEFTPEEEKAVVRRIDKRVLVIILWAYFFQQLDKSSLR